MQPTSTSDRQQGTQTAPRWARPLVLLLFVIGGALGLVLWGKWGFLIAFDTIRTYCF